ncbi:MAG: MFS transporter [Anaerolineae bacterium]|nr:MFS transporter [Anaerolineae bacterium]
MTRNRNVTLLYWFNFFLKLKFYNAILVIYFVYVTGSYALAMSVFAVASLSSTVFELPTGVFSDLIGRKRTLVLGATAHAGAVIFFAVGGGYAALVVGGICEGLARALFSGNNAALLHDTLAESGQEADYQEYLGRTTAMEHVGVALVGVTGSVLVALTSFAAVMWLSVFPQLVLVGIALAFREPQTTTPPAGNPFAHVQTAWRILRRNHRLRLLSAASVIGYSVGEAAYQLRVAFIDMLWPLWAVGVARMLDNIMAAASYYFSGRLIRRFSALRVLVGGGLVGRAVMVLAYGVPTGLSPVLLSATSTLHGVTNVAQDSLMQHEFSTEQRATLGSLVALGGSLVFAAASVLIGGLADWLGLVAVLLLAQVVLLVPVWLNWRAFHTSGRDAVARGDMFPASGS